MIQIQVFDAQTRAPVPHLVSGAPFVGFGPFVVTSGAVVSGTTIGVWYRDQAGKIREVRAGDFDRRVVVRAVGDGVDKWRALAQVQGRDGRSNHCGALCRCGSDLPRCKGEGDVRIWIPDLPKDQAPVVPRKEIREPTQAEIDAMNARAQAVRDGKAAQEAERKAMTKAAAAARRAARKR